MCLAFPGPVIEGGQGRNLRRNLKEKSWRNAACCFALSFVSQDLRNGTTHSGLGPHMLINNQDNSPQTH